MSQDEPFNIDIPEMKPSTSSSSSLSSCLARITSPEQLVSRDVSWQHLDLNPAIIGEAIKVPNEILVRLPANRLSELALEAYSILSTSTSLNDV